MNTLKTLFILVNIKMGNVREGESNIEKTVLITKVTEIVMPRAARVV